MLVARVLAYGMEIPPAFWPAAGTGRQRVHAMRRSAAFDATDSAGGRGHGKPDLAVLSGAQHRLPAVCVVKRMVLTAGSSIFHRFIFILDGA